MRRPSTCTSSTARATPSPGTCLRRELPDRQLRRSAGESRSGPTLAPQLWRNAARALELAAEVIDVGEAAQFGDLGHRQPLLGEQGLGLQQPFADQPLPRTGAQMPPK